MESDDVSNFLTDIYLKISKNLEILTGYMLFLHSYSGICYSYPVNGDQ